MKINIEVIPHNEQRYDTAGDYWTDKAGTLQVRISRMRVVYVWLVLLHELVEIFLCQMQGVKFSAIDKFDIKYENDRGRGLHSNTDEPGDDRAAPYGRQHCMATALERMLCAYLDVAWRDYEDACNALEYDRGREMICAVE
jgi:hypothetical protein